MAKILVFLVFILCSFGKSEAQTGGLSGLVTDSSGAPLPGVNVLVEDAQTGTATDEDGRFRIANLTPGTYALAISAVGFRRSREVVEVAADQTMFLHVVLEQMSFRAGEVVVTASRRAQLSSSVPASFNLVSPRELEMRSVVTLDRALRYVPGVQVMENQVNIRGSSGYVYNVGSRVLLLLDGLPLLTPDSDGVPFDALPFNHIERIEIVKGPGSALYGSGALGGVIQVITEDYPRQPESTARLFTGLYDPVSREDWLEKWPEGRDPRPFWGVTVSHARKIGEQFGFWFNADYRDDRGYANMMTERFAQLYAKIGWRPAPATSIDILLAGLSRRKENFLFWNGLDDALNPGIPTIADTTRRAATDVQTDQLIIAPSFRHVLTNSLLVDAKLRAYGARIEGVGDDEVPSGNVTYGFRYGGEGQLTWNPDAQRNFVLGGSGDANSTDSPFFTTSEGEPIGNQPEISLFAQYEDAPASPLRVVAGLRYSAYSVTTTRTIDKLSPKLAVSFIAGEGLSFRASFGQGFRVPSLPERFFDEQAFVPLFPNLELLPEESTSYEVGIRWDSGLPSGGSFRFDAAGFWNEYEGLIEPKLVRISPPGEPFEFGFRFVNLRSARIIGLEASIDLELPQGIASGAAGYTYMHSKDLGDDLPLPFRPEHLFNATARARILGPVETGADFRFSSAPERLESDFSPFVNDADVWLSAEVIDYWISVSQGAIRFSLHARNAFDNYYNERPAFLAAPRSYLAEIKLEI